MALAHDTLERLAAYIYKAPQPFVKFLSFLIFETYITNLSFPPWLLMPSFGRPDPYFVTRHCETPAAWRALSLSSPAYHAAASHTISTSLLHNLPVQVQNVTCRLPWSQASN